MTLRETLLKAEHYLDEYKRQTKEKLGLFEKAILYPYRGYGNDTKAVLKGRVLEKEKAIHGDNSEDKGIVHNALRFLKRYESDEIPGVRIKASFAGDEQEVTSNDDGYFEFWFSYERKPAPGWHDVQLHVTGSEYDVPMETEAVARIFIPRDDARFGVISDVDDTLIESNATNLIERIKTMVTHTARSRPVFEGAVELYDTFSDNYKNPLWFVSGSSYNLHDLLTELCHFNDIPEAPFLLRDLGLDDTQWLKRDTAAYKMEHLRHIFNMYPGMNFILFGDSGQQDPEIYRKTEQEFPDRILAVYIRHVADESRGEQIKTMARDMRVPLVMIRDSSEAISHAKELNLI